MESGERDMVMGFLATCARAAFTLCLCLACDAGWAADAGEVNVALASSGAVVASDSDYGAQSAALAIDGNWVGPGDAPDANRWHSSLERPHPHWVWIRFREPALISRIVIHRADIVGYPVDITSEYSPDGGLTMRRLFTIRDNRMDQDLTTIERSFAPVVTDNVRVLITRSSNEAHPEWAQLSEIEVFGRFTGRKQGERTAAPKPVRTPKREHSPTRADGLTVTDRGDCVEFRSKWLRLVVSRSSGRITELCWDSLGEGKVDVNLLKPGPDGGAGVALATVLPDSPGRSGEAQIEIDGNVVRCAARLAEEVDASWELRVEAKAARMVLTSAADRGLIVRTPPGVRFAFDVSKTPVAPLANPTPGVAAPLPCLLHAADYGTLLVRGTGVLDGQPLRHIAQWNATIVSLVPRREDGLWVLPSGASRMELTLSVESAAPMSSLIARDSRLRGLPRHWLNTFQYRPDIGILANNVVSDNAVFCMHTFADAAVFTPPLPGGIEAISMVRESLDRYFAGAYGYGVGWEDIMTEIYPSLLIAAWDVVRVTGDTKTIARWLPKLESFAARMKAQDRNGNGLPESTKPGTSGEVRCPTSNWWDQINFGYEDAYSCALAYRALRCLADLERLSNRLDRATGYESDAERIRAAYLPTFMNPETGIIAGWKDANGALHDYWFVFVNAVAIVNGLVPDDAANAMVDRIEAKMREVGYSRFDLGLPGNLVPVRKDDYGIGALGSPKNDDGADTFGVFENGGASACYAYYYVQALYKLGRRAEAERILWPMMKTYAEGGFQNGVGRGGEWRHWDGRPSGYEGFLSDAYLSQLALFTGHYGIGFGPDGFRLEPWSPLGGRRVGLGLKYMGKVAAEVR